MNTNTPLSKNPLPELADRPTVREFKRQMARVRWERRLARTIPRYRLKLLFLLIVAMGVLGGLALLAQSRAAG